MKNINPPTSGKISVHGRGAGPVTDRDIEDRAREIALIEGHSNITGEDRRRATLELRGLDDDAAGGDDSDDAVDSLSRDPSDPPSNRGHQVPNYEGDDDQKMPEKLVAEGVEEAEHEQMLEARRHRPGR